MDLLEISAVGNELSAEDAIRSALQGLTRSEQLSKLVRFFEAATDRDTQLTELIAEAWEYLNANSLWDSRYSSLEALKQDIDYDYSLKRILERHQANSGRRKNEMRAILGNWNHPPDTALPSSLQPPIFSEKILRSLATLSRITSLDTAIPLLYSAMQARMSTPLLHKHKYLITSDVLDAIKKLQTPKPNVQLQTDAQIAIEREGGEDGNGEGNSKGNGDEESDCGGEGGDEDGGGIGDEEGNGDEEVDCGGNGGDEDGDEGEDEEDSGEDGNVKEQGHEKVGMRKRRASRSDDVENRGEEEREVEARKKGRGRRKKKGKRRGEQEVVCCCPITLVRDIQGMKGNNDDPCGFQLLGNAIEVGLGVMCHFHLRALAPATVGLLNNMSNSKIQERLDIVWTNRSRIYWQRCRKPHWFLKNRRPQSKADSLVVYRYHPLPTPIFQFNEIRVFERFAGRGSWSTWERDGTIIIPGLFSFLDRPDIRRSIDIEFALYRHHHRSLPGRSRLGWLRNMFYSIIQQIVRQDPVWYALNAAARPDKNWRLISYPYITKDTDPGENTGFLHLDLNTTQYVKDGSGGNLLSSSISLDDEQADGCTLGVLGFHRSIHDWHKRLVERGEDTAGFTTNCSAAYRAQDRADWGEPIPLPCPAFGLRLTRPEIIHGSTPHSYRRRRSVFAWHTGIDYTHTELDLKGTLSWNDLAACHRDLEAPSKEPSGQAPRYGLPLFRFPGSVVTGSPSAIGDALIGRRKWVDPQVVRERDILLGDNDEAARSYVDLARAKMIERFEEAFKQLEAAETEAFGENSYFHRKKFGLSIRSGGDSEESDGDSAA